MWTRFHELTGIDLTLSNKYGSDLVTYIRRIVRLHRIHWTTESTHTKCDEPAFIFVYSIKGVEIYRTGLITVKSLSSVNDELVRAVKALEAANKYERLCND